MNCHLTDRELECIRHLADGLTYKQIARQLGLSDSTVRNHLHHAYQRLGVVNAMQAVLVCDRHGWIGEPRPEVAEETMLIKRALDRLTSAVLSRHENKLTIMQRRYLTAFETWLRDPQPENQTRREAALTRMLHDVPPALRDVK